MVSVLDPESSGPVWCPGKTLCCVMGQDTLLSLCLSPSCCRRINGCNPTIDWHLIQSGVEILLYSLYATEVGHKRRPYGRLGSYPDFTLPTSITSLLNPKQ